MKHENFDAVQTKRAGAPAYYRARGATLKVGGGGGG